jgi:REP element-mobilizing transposase RayT
MSNYHRLYIPGGSYFFTLVTEQRRPFLCEPPMRAALKSAMAAVRRKHPFHVAGMVLLPDHMHMVWTLPQGDSDFPLRVRLIKSHMTKACGSLVPHPLNQRRQHKQCGALWQHRYWEHALRSATTWITCTGTRSSTGWCSGCGIGPGRLFTLLLRPALIRLTGARRRLWRVTAAPNPPYGRHATRVYVG